VNFFIDRPWIEVYKPQQGQTIYTSYVEISAYAENFSSIQILLDGVDYTSWFVISAGHIHAILDSMNKGPHAIKFILYNPNGNCEHIQSFVMDWGDARVVLTLSNHQISTGESITYSYQVFDANGNDVTSQVVVHISADPSTGVVIDEGNKTIKFYRPGLVKVIASTVYQGDELVDNEWVRVSMSDIGDVVLTLSDYDIDAGATILASVSIFDTNGDPIYTDYALTADPHFGVTISGDNITLKREGVVTIRATVTGSDQYDEKQVTVHAGPPVSLDLVIPQPTIKEGDSVTPLVESLDQYGNLTNDPYHFIISPMTGVHITGGSIEFDNSGYYIITAMLNFYPSLYDSEIVTVMDTIPPDIVVTVPQRGQMIHGSYTPVQGYVANTDPPSTTLKINGETVPVNPVTGAFSWGVSLFEGVNFIELVATDGVGNRGYAGLSVLSYDDLVATNDWVPDALGIHIGQQTIDTLTVEIRNLFGSLLPVISDALMAMNPLFDESLVVWGVTVASARADFEYVQFGNPILEVTPRSGDLYVLAGIWNIVIGVRVTGTIGPIPFSVLGEVGCDKATVGASVVPTIQDNKLTLVITSTDLNIDNLWFQIYPFPEELFDPFIAMFQGLVESLIEDYLIDELNNLIQDAFGDLSYNYDFSLLGHTYNIAALPVAVSMNPNSNGIDLWTDTKVTSDYVSPIPPSKPGSLYTSHNRVVFPAYVPNIGGENYGFGALLSDDMINQALYTMYRTGVLDQDLTPAGLTTSNSIIQYIFPELVALYPNNQITIKLRPQLMPVLLLDPGSAVTAHVQLGDMFIDMYVVASGQEILFLEMALSADIPATINISGQPPTIRLHLNNNPEAILDVILTPIVDVNETLLESIVPLLMQIIGPFLENFVDEIQIPTIAGFTLNVKQFLVYGPQNDFMGLFANINPVENDAAGIIDEH